MDNKILVFIPCYNCENQIPRVIQKLETANTKDFFEILILDNQSSDNTAKSAITALEKTQNLNASIAINNDNYGLGGSHKAAFNYALEHNFDYVIVLHGDDQGNINDLLPLLKSKVYEDYDACLGSRFMKGSKTLGYSPFRIFGNKVFNFIFSLGTAKKVEDLGSGLNIFSKRTFEKESITKYSDDLRFNVYLLLGLFRDKNKIMFFPIQWSEIDQVSNVRLFSQARNTITLLLESIFLQKKFVRKDHRDKEHSSYKFKKIFTKSPNNTSP